MYGHVHTPIPTYGFLYECAEKENSDILLLSLKKIIIIEKLKWIACKTQAVILSSYFSSATTRFIYVVSKDNDKA